MEETANILKNATEKSFVILDEVGRGTSIQDGISLAYGILKHLLSKNQCRGIFSTHYHELAQVVDSLNAQCHSHISCHRTKIATTQVSLFEYSSG
jgi:DNA mismatch repair protein MutS